MRNYATPQVTKNHLDNFSGQKNNPLSVDMFRIIQYPSRSRSCVPRITSIVSISHQTELE